MKLQSRPPEATRPVMSAEEVSDFGRVVLDIEGSGQNRMYKSVILKGAMQMLMQQQVIRQYQIMNDDMGYYGFRLTIEMPDYKLEHFYL